MDRKAIEAELNRKKKELARLQKQFLKAENGHNSQKKILALQQTSLVTDTAEIAVPIDTHSQFLTPRGIAVSYELTKSYPAKTSDHTSPQNIACTCQNNKTMLQDIESNIRTTSQDTMVSCQDTSQMRTSMGVRGHLEDECIPQDLLNQGYFEDGPHTLSCAKDLNVPTQGPDVCPACHPDTNTNTDHCKTHPAHSTHTSHLPRQMLISPHAIPISPHAIPISPHAIPTSPHVIYTQHASPCMEPHPLPSSMALPPLVSMPTTQQDFYLPDNEYQALKLLKLTSVKNGGATGLGRSGVGTQSIRGCRVQPRPLSVEAVNRRPVVTELTPDQLGYCGSQNDCGIRPNCNEDSENTFAWEHMFDGTSQVMYDLDSSFNFKATVEVVGRRLLGVALAKGTLSVVHLEEGKVCVHMLPPGVSVTPNTGWLCASWMMMQQKESIGNCFILVQDNTTFCFVAVIEEHIVTCLRLCIVNSNEGYILNMNASDKSCTQAQIHSWSCGDQVLVAMALTEKESCHSVVCIWSLARDNECRWQTVDGLGTRLPLPKNVGMITSLHEVVGVAWQLLGSTSTSAVLWDTHSHGLLVVVKLCCCLSGCELQPVVVGTSCEESTLFLLLGCKQVTTPPSKSHEDGRHSIAWLVACKITAPAAVPNECIKTTPCDLVQSYTCTSKRVWDYQWCEDTVWNFATQVSQNTLLLWNLLSTSPCGALSFGDDLEVGPPDNIKVYWMPDRKQMIVMSGESVYILSAQSKPASCIMDVNQTQ